MRNIGHWQNQALEQPIAITYHGRERLILVSARQYGQARPANDHPEIDGAAPELQWLLDTISEGYVLQTRNLDIIRVNGVAAAMFNVAPAQMIGRKMSEMLPAAGGAVLAERAAMVLRTGRLDTFEGEGAAFGNRFLSFQMAPVGDKIVTLVSNQTDRKIVEEGKEIGEAVCHAIAELPGIAGVRLNGFGRIVVVGDRFQAYSGFSATELNDVRLTDIMSQQHKRSFTDLFEQALSRNQTESLDVAFLLKKGDVAAARASIAPLPQSGSGAGAVVMVAFSGQQ